MGSKVHPSPAIVVRADTPISECITLMKEEKVGSLLIVKDRDRGELEGIFTERDLLNKFDLIHRDNNVSHPIRTVMTIPVHTLDISELNRASELMVKYQIRHLPITITIPIKGEKRKTLVGVISMRDLHKVLASQQQNAMNPLAPLSSTSKIKPKINLITGDTVLVSFFQQTLAFFMSAEVKTFNIYDEFIEPAHVLIVDLDRIPVSTWLRFLKARNSDPMIKLIVVIFNPELQNKEIIKVLEQVGNSEKFLLLKKPIDVFPLYEGIAAINLSHLI
jgi:CBS domain-containing protein